MMIDEQMQAFATRVDGIAAEFDPDAVTVARWLGAGASMAFVVTVRCAVSEVVHVHERIAVSVASRFPQVFFSLVVVAV